ncbi:MAG: secondary thiamine-phosphate synthase enzyme YjbQ [Rhodomicrobiaceae bacterium]
MQNSFFQKTDLIQIETSPYSFHMITSKLDFWLREIGASEGLLTLLVKHTSASLTIQENADPTVRDDLLTILDELAPETRDYRHNMEGPDDMPAHIKTMLTNTTLSIPIVDGKMDLGTWQGVYLIEHRAHRMNRSIRLFFAGTDA